MATSKNDPRITKAINTAMAWERGQVGKATARSVWSIAYPQWKNSGYAWCGGFQVAAYRQAGVDLMKCAWWFYTPYIRNFARKIGAWKTSGQQYGDMPLFDWTLDGVIDHVGAAWPDPKASAYRSVEGNTSRGTAGSQSNGGGAWVRYRTKPTLRGWVDMRKVLAYMIDHGLWAPGESAKSTVNKPLTNVSGSTKLVEDGFWGTATTRRLQQVLGTTVDGIVSSQSSAWKYRNPGLGSGWQWVNNPKGSTVIKAMQKKLGVRSDGLIGPATINALSKRYGVRGDGKLDKGSITIKAMQRKLNQGKF